MSKSDYTFETTIYFPIRLKQVMLETDMLPHQVYLELDELLNNPKSGDILTPFYSDVRVKTITVKDVKKHILYVLDERHKIIVLIEATKYDLRYEKQHLLYSLAALYELRRCRKLILKMLSGGLV